MIHNIIISSMFQEGIDIYKMAKEPLDLELRKAIIEKTYKNNSTSGDLTLISHKGFEIYSAIYSYKDDPNKRDNLYSIHVITDEKIIGMTGMMISLAKQFAENGLHYLDKENLNIILLSMNLHAKNIEVSHNNILYTIFFDWSENDGGRLQVWK